MRAYLIKHTLSGRFAVVMHDLAKQGRHELTSSAKQVVGIYDTKEDAGLAVKVLMEFDKGWTEAHPGEREHAL